MSKRLLSILAVAGFVLASVFGGSPKAGALPAEDRSTAKPAELKAMHRGNRAFLQNHCVECHDEATKEGGFQLDDLAGKDFDPADNKRWSKILEMVDLGDMPPPERKQPSDDQREASRHQAESIPRTTGPFSG